MQTEVTRQQRKIDTARVATSVCKFQTVPVPDSGANEAFLVTFNPEMMITSGTLEERKRGPQPESLHDLTVIANMGYSSPHGLPTRT